MRRTVLEDDGPVGQTGGRRCQVMQALVAAIQAFGMQNPIDFGCHWPPRTIKGREGGLKRFGFGMLTQKAGPVTGSGSAVASSRKNNSGSSYLFP